MSHEDSSSARKLSSKILVAKSGDGTRAFVSVASDAPVKVAATRVWLRAMRVHHWTKNTLVFLGLILAHKFHDVAAWKECGRAFFAFSLLASAVYIFNDLMDLDADRAHEIKRHRPFASGRLSIQAGLVALPVLLGVAGAIAWALPGNAALMLGAYLVVNLVYSTFLKKLLIVDVITLSCLHISRILVGAAASDISVSSWLIAFSCFFFFGLAMLKRFAELKQSTSLGDTPGRGYHYIDQAPIFAIGLGSSLISVLVFVLYVESPRTSLLYSHPNRLWLATPLLLYWVSRVWLLAERGIVTQDPVSFALKDKATWVTAIVLLATFFFSI